jgi:tetratricopeptide (TPR) repeat protein
MKKAIQFLAVIILFCAASLHAQDLSQGQRWIKIGNSLREVQQFDQAEIYLNKGLKVTRTFKNKYWEAVACEDLGLLYADTEEKVTAGRYFNSALEIFKSLNMELSIKVINDFMSAYNITQNNVWQTYGGIDLGSKGVKFTIIRVKKNAGAFTFKSVKDASKNTQIIDFTPEAINETVKAVKAYVDTLINNNISMDNIFVAVSSGVKQEADKVPGRQEQLTNALIAGVPEYTKKIEFMTACDEGDLTIKGVVPPKVLYRSSLIDIGSGNTKGGYRERDQANATCINIPWGTVTFTKKFAGKNNKLSYAEQFFADSINSVITRQVQNNGDLTNRVYSYFTGGIVWAMCNYMHAESIKADFTEFTKADVDKFLELAKNDYEQLINPDLTRINDEAFLKEAKKQIGNSKSTFTQDNIIAGAMLLQGIVNEMDSTGAKKKFVFVRFGSVGWISGYIVKRIDAGYAKIAE